MITVTYRFLSIIIQPPLFFGLAIATNSSGPQASSPSNILPQLTHLSTFGEWSYFGCYSDNPGNRSLRNYIHIPNTNLTEEDCLIACSQYKYAGLEYGRECWCDYDIDSTSQFVTDGCDLPCSGKYQTLYQPDLGNLTELCGGNWKLTTFVNKGYVSPMTANKSISRWTNMGCYTDRLQPRALPDQVYYDNAMSVNKCLQFCGIWGSSWAGLEYGSQCYCGDRLADWSEHNGSVDPISFGCNMPCGGTHSW